ELGERLLDLLGRRLLHALDDRSDERPEPAMALAAEVALELVRDDAERGVEVLVALAVVLADDRLEVVEVVDEDARELLDGRLHVARHRDVEEEERAAAARLH